MLKTFSGTGKIDKHTKSRVVRALQTISVVEGEEVNDYANKLHDVLKAGTASLDGYTLGYIARELDTLTEDVEDITAEDLKTYMTNFMLKLEV